MADVTGRIYEAFTEFILQRLGYRDEWTAGNGRQFLYEKHRAARCYQSIGVCAHASECRAISQQNNIPYGPWYDPDFFILDSDQPYACFHVTHWSEQRSSKKKFWRTVEDHFQYKALFGHAFLSINLLFVALSRGDEPQLITDTSEKVHLQGWDPAIGSVLVSTFDSSIVFPVDYEPLEVFASTVPPGRYSNARRRREVFNQIWLSLYSENQDIQQRIDQVVELFQVALSNSPNPRFSTSAVAQIQSTCYQGRSRVHSVSPSESRYRKGLQLAFIVQEMIANQWGNIINAGTALWNVLLADPRFTLLDLKSTLGLPAQIQDTEVNSFIQLLASIPIRMDKFIPQPLLDPSAGIEHFAWDLDLAQFIRGLHHLSDEDLLSFRLLVDQLFLSYHNAYGMSDILADLFDIDRVQRKIEYVAERYIGLTDRQTFIDLITSDLLIPGENPPHQHVVSDIHNWVLDVILTFYNLGSIQDLESKVVPRYEQRYGESLRLYNYRMNIGHLLAGRDIIQNISSEARFNRGQFYAVIWSLVAECLWEALVNKTPVSSEDAFLIYRYKKARRIIASDTDPIAFLFRQMLPNLSKGPRLRGAFNQLSVQRSWSREACTTDVSGIDSRSGALIQTQAVFGKKHIADKTREVAARLRSIHLKCAEDGTFEPEPNPGIHYLVVDGDWPIDSKINLYEAGFKGIYEIGELEQLAEELDSLTEEDQH